MKSESLASNFRCLVGRFVRVSGGKVAVERKVSVFLTEKNEEGLRDLQILAK